MTIFSARFNLLKLLMSEMSELSEKSEEGVDRKSIF